MDIREEGRAGLPSEECERAGDVERKEILKLRKGEGVWRFFDVREDWDNVGVESTFHVVRFTSLSVHLTYP